MSYLGRSSLASPPRTSSVLAALAIACVLAIPLGVAIAGRARLAASCRRRGVADHSEPRAARVVVPLFAASRRGPQRTSCSSCADRDRTGARRALLLRHLQCSEHGRGLASSIRGVRAGLARRHDAAQSLLRVELPLALPVLAGRAHCRGVDLRPRDLSTPSARRASAT